MKRAEKATFIGCCIAMAVGTGTSLYLKDLRPALLTACLAWLGAEYIDHMNEQAHR